ncbi:sensor histidine kinase [Methylobacterium nodulans]|uniref:C4-dicarboxylate transport sensor protein DctB n=1 Tax=Methylobacterium nodulans (strain LMG 21967 / CNCM I-2342 / ORS 2060) TaxID=460265 RepID=B8IUD2_METNO|nr:ATP-binding protein [Methylobacterium nodulans]ACL55177.1 histidine kinase [Methylobacterium nodulans ORS 2060]
MPEETRPGPVPASRTTLRGRVRKSATPTEPRRRQALAWAAALAIVVLAAWSGGRIAERAALADLRRSALSGLTLQVAALRAEMQKQASLPLALAADPEIARVVAAQAEPGLADRVSFRLSEIAGATGAAVIYVIRADGLTAAASNAGTATSFVGNDYTFRPYFREALAEGAGSQFALGTVSGRPGLYLSRRIAGGSGVVVVKVEFDGVEAAWRGSGAQVFATDPRGIVLVSSEPAWRFRALGPVEAAERQRIRERLDFGNADLSPLPLHPVGESGLMRLGGAATPARLVLPLDAAVPDTTWRLHTLTPVGAAVRRERLQTQVLAGVVAGAACAGIAVHLGRRRRIRSRLAEEASRREELERRVQERTRALTDANAQLRAEMAERQRAEAERERLGRELAQAGRLAALGQFAASMAHEINQPLAAIRSYADNAAILIRRGRIEDASENFSAIGRLTERIAGLTRQLKGFARRASGRREPVSLAGVLRNALEVVEARAATGGVTLAVDRPEPDLIVLGDGARLEQVVVNLLQNALDAVAGRPDPRVTVRAAALGDRALLEVGDNGPGIPDSVRAQVFDPFFTTKAEGLGLGLAISRGIVEECGGTLAVATGEAGGAVFRVDLARTQAAEEAA